ncbi:MAG: AMP-binding protein [Polyangia bacterium]|jgi:acyl-CoA synthetase (AMP-forming)/AMP-acid ligase II|nr:AMP-binding protein [Polyangia bacterium]
MAHWLNLGEMLKLNAHKYPSTICLMDAQRRFTFPETNRRVNRLASALLGLGLGKGDRISALMENCIEFVELYLAAAKVGLLVNPINFRLAGPEIRYIVDHAESKAFVVHDEFCPTIEAVRPALPRIEAGRYVVVGEPTEGYLAYEELLAMGDESEPQAEVRPEDPWILLYTSGTTGTPKGVVRSHESYVAFYLINAIDFGFRPRDVVLNIMPLCHVNTTFFTFAHTYVGGSTYVHPARGFDAREVLRVIGECRASFISLIPTHYALMLALPVEERARYDVSSVRKLLCSSAPARVEHKVAVMDWFKGVELYEGYGSTEAGIVTTLFPEEQLTKPGSIGKESVGTDFVKILGPDKQPVPRGQIGELYSRGPMLFDCYFKDPARTAEAMAGEWFSAGDMAYQDEDGYFFLVDRKNNMIITGGENVFPSEVEQVLCAHEGVFDAAVIGLPDPKWGEAIHAVVIPRDPTSPPTADALKALCRERIASYKVPKTFAFIPPDEMPRTATGKILHRILRERYAKG